MDCCTASERAPVPPANSPPKGLPPGISYSYEYNTSTGTAGKQRVYCGSRLGLKTLLYRMLLTYHYGTVPTYFRFPHSSPAARSRHVPRRRAVADVGRAGPRQAGQAGALWAGGPTVGCGPRPLSGGDGRRNKEGIKKTRTKSSIGCCPTVPENTYFSRVIRHRT